MDTNLLIFASLMVPLLLLGIFGNLNLLIATIRFKQLQRRNGILIGIIAFLDLVSDLFETLDCIRIFLDAAHLTRRNCFNSISVYQFIFNFSCISVLSLAIDRLIAVTFPIIYRTIKTSHYIGFTIAAGTLYATPFVVAGFLLVDDTLVEPCNPPLAYAPQLSVIWNRGYSTIAIAVIAINAFCMLRLYFNQKKPRTCGGDSLFQQRQARVTHTMFIVMLVYAVSYLSASVIVFVVHNLQIPNQLRADILTYVALLVLINYGSTYYILFWRSKDYRAAFLTQLHLRSDRVTPLNRYDKL